MTKRTKIICTIGPATESYSSIRELYKAGMNVARLNMSHSDHRKAKKVIGWIKKLNEKVKNPVGILLDRINKRGNPEERFLTSEYLERINEAYSKFFLDYDDAPLLIVNASDINLEDESNDYNLLMDSIVSNPKGKNFINPQPSIF